MPIYEYQCRSCDHQFEELVRGSETPECEECGGDQLVKLPSMIAAPSSSPSTTPGSLPMGPPCGMGGCGRPECD